MSVLRATYSRSFIAVVFSYFPLDNLLHALQSTLFFFFSFLAAASFKGIGVGTLFSHQFNIYHTKEKKKKKKLKYKKKMSSLKLKVEAE